jgi:hypothetical protein
MIEQPRQVEASPIYNPSHISTNEGTPPIKIKKWANEFFSTLYHLPTRLAGKLFSKNSLFTEEWEVKEDRELGLLVKTLSSHIDLLKESLDKGNLISPDALSKLKQNIAGIKELIKESVDSEFIEAHKETLEILEKKFEILNKQAEFRAIPEDVPSLKASFLADGKILKNSLENSPPSITALLELKRKLSANSIQKLQAHVCGHNKIGADLQPLLNKKPEHLSASNLETLAKYLPPDASKEVFNLAKALVALQKKSLNHVDELVSNVKNIPLRPELLSSIRDEIQSLHKLKANLTYKISGTILFFTNDKENMQKILRPSSYSTSNERTNTDVKCPSDTILK